MMDKVAVEPGEYSSSTLRMFRYYNPTDQPQPDVTHIDIALGALIPACEIPGLQIFNKSLDSWIDVERTCRPLKDLIFFPGDVIEVRAFPPSCTLHSDRATGRIIFCSVHY
jgi:hypothetical protein